MSAIVLGKNAQFLLGKGTGSKIDFTGVLEGTEALSTGRTFDVRPIPGGRGVAASQAGSFETHSATLTCDSNDVHDPVLRGSNIRRLYYTFRPEGVGRSKVEYIGEAVATLRLTADVPRDVFRWQVSLAVDGSPTKQNQT